MEKVGVIGSGGVAQTLAKGFAARGHAVRIGSRDPSKLAAFTAETGIEAGTFDAVAAFGELLVLAVKGSAALDALGLAGEVHLEDKIVVDTTNPIADAPPDRGVIRFFTNANESLMERLQRAFPAARFVKAWNSIGAPFMVDPVFPEGPPTMFICGDDAAAKARVTTLLRAFGWDVEDVGHVESARALEPLCQLWCAPGFLRGQWAHGYKVLRLP